MTIDLLNDRLLTFAQAAELVPSRLGGRATVSPETIDYWVKKGVRLPGGGRLKLETLWVVGRRVTSVRALERFLAAQNRGTDQLAESAPGTAPTG